MSGRLSKLVAVAVALGAITVAHSNGVASAAAAPLMPRPANAVTADALPTVQVDGVVWSQAIVGNTVYAGGDFQNARPAGAAPGTNLVPRTYLLAFDITTGELITSFAPQLNGQVLAVAASPDGSRVYVAGDFTTADGQPRKRVAAYDTATGQLIAGFNPKGPSSQARALAVTNDTVFVGGGFTGTGLTVRNNLLALRASDGTLLAWDPNADYTVSALALAEDGSAVFAGGSFQNVGGQPAYGLAKINAATGALMPWNATLEVRNAGLNAGVTSLRVANGIVYGTTYHFGTGGNLEGPFAVSASTGDLTWAADCHGDTYSSAESNGTVYVVGHSHYCGNVGGGFPQPPSGAWDYQRALAFTKDATGTNLHEPLGYPKDWFGKPSPSIVHWTPSVVPGTFTGQGQGAWSVAATDQYVVLGGEFPTINGTAQQGLVRFGRSSVAPNLQKPLLTGGAWVPTVVPTSTTSVRVSWKTATDRDDRGLTYKVIRDSAWGSPAFQTIVDSNWWNLPAAGFVDTGRTPGATYRYQIVVSDPAGNTVFSNSAAVTMPTTWTQTPHATQVLADQPSIYWPLNGTAGPVLAAGGVNDGSPGSSLVYNQPGIDASTGVRLDGTANGRIYASGTDLAPNVFTAQAWIKTNTTSGGRILGFGDNRTAVTNGHRDRHIYMLNDGKLAFGVWAAGGMLTTVSPKSYNDNLWHQVTATLGPSGMQLYVDGVRVATRGEITEGQQYLGYWRVGGDNLTNWPNKPSKNDFTGSVDEVAIYPTALTQQQIDAQWVASGRTSLLPAPPADSYGAAVRADEPVLYWRLGEASGTAATDSSASLSPGTYRGSGWTLGQTGAITGTANTAARSTGSSGFVSSNTSSPGPQRYSVEAWFKSTSTQGGKLIGFGNNQSSNSTTTDRHIYMQNDGKLVFGILNGGQQKITTAGTFNDGQWHHVVGTQSATGIKLYVDGLLTGTNPQATAQAYNGYWRVAGDTTWGSTSRFLNGTVDEAAVYSSALSAARVAAHYVSGGGVNGNQPPSAGFTSSSNFLTASFDGSGSSDPNGPIASYAWNFGDGSTGSGATPSHTYSTAGTYTVTLTVTDSAGAIDIVSHDVTVVANQAPTAAFTSSSHFLAASFDGSGSSDVDGPIASYAWNFGDGSTGSGATPSHTYAAAGTYTVTLTVTDAAAMTGTISHDVTVVANQAPTAAFTSSNVFLEASFNGSGSVDADGTIVGYDWDFGDGSAHGNEATSSHTYAAAGTYPVTLTVTDDEGAIGTFTDDLTVEEEPPNQAPTAAFTSSNVFLAASFDGAGSSDVDGTIAGYDWDFGDGSDDGNGAISSHTYAAAGTYTVTLTVTDDEGATGIISHDVTVAEEPPNQAPTAAFTSSSVFLAASFNGSGSSDPEGPVTAHAWNFGDGSTGSGATASHTYAASGTYTVTLTVTDDDGVTGAVSQDIVVQAQQVFAADTFGRTVTNGLGVADVGGAWTNSSGATNFAVSNGSASMNVATVGAAASGYLNAVSATNVEAVVDVSYDKVATGGGFYTSLVTRRVGTSDYRVKVRVVPTGTQLYLARTVGGIETVLASGVVPGTFAPGSVIRVRLQTVGTGTTTLRAKAWYTSSTEPAAWMLTATDTTASLQNPGAVGIYTYVSGSSTNVPVKTFLDNFWVGAL